jgi:branched-chain amino acid transport system ATP-binding protein
LTLLSLSNVETLYGLNHALRGVSLDVHPGTVTAVLGNNGAGKTTILKTTVGLLDDQPDKGTISFNGQRIDGKETEDIIHLGLSYVPEGREVFDELTVDENLRMGGYIRSDRQNMKNDLERMYEMFPALVARRTELAGRLSGGEQQMLAIGRALMNQPKLLFLDEPSLGLSPLLVKEIFSIIQKIKSDGVTILLVEQNANMALNVADFAYVLENGRFVISGTPDELRADEDVREFYLGMKAKDSAKGFQRYRRKRRWA